MPQIFAWTPPQIDREELLDLNRGSFHQARKSLLDIRRINTFLGGARVIEGAVWRLLEGRKSATVVDVGTGSGDLPRRLVLEARKRGVRLQILALDLNARHLEVARQELQSFPEISLLRADAFTLPLADQGADITIASLFLHHFRPPQIGALFGEFERVSRLGWAANDLVRDFVPLMFFRLAAPVFARSYITRHDGKASILRAYTAPEMRKIAHKSRISGIEVREVFPYRLSVVKKRSAADEI